MTAAKARRGRPGAADLYAGRRAKLKGLMKEDALGRPTMALIFSGEERHLEPFTPDPTFFYLTGVESPGALLFLARTPRQDMEVLLLPATDPAKERWTGKLLSAGGLTTDCQPDGLRAEAGAKTGISASTIGAFEQLEEVLIRPMREAAVVYMNFPEDMPPGQVGLVQHFADRLRTTNPHLQFRHAGRMVGDLRRVKDGMELDRMRAAMAVTDEAQRAVLGHLRSGMAEYEIQALIEYVFRARGAQQVAFPSIIGSGPNSCFLHYDKNRRVAKRGDLVICDVGCRKDLYCADVTRTYPVGGKFTKRQRKVYDTVLAAHDAAIAAAKPGVFVRDVHQAASEVIARAGFAPYFFHGTSHYLGIDPHDAGSYDLALEPGVVITVEPGIYIAAEELGVRIEDDVLITEKGAETMTLCPRDPGEIEKLLARPRKTLSV
jgi:Xaa-Pro aminopeptidase